MAHVCANIHVCHDAAYMHADAAVCIRGLDVGCGASFIYCLLGAAMYGWHMTGLDITQAGAVLVLLHPVFFPFPFFPLLLLLVCCHALLIPYCRHVCKA